jgi:CubicO group peptidase (beta-lactamase class C family)
MSGAPLATVTVRQLLSQTSGLPASIECPTPAACDAAIATTTLLGEPGTVFTLSPVGYHVLARVAEAVTGRDWEAVADERILGPLGLNATRFTEPPREPSAEDPPDAGLLAADGVTTADDLGGFLTMILSRGESPEGRVLEQASVEEMERDQTPALDTSAEPWVGATGIPTYGLGVWRDRLRGDGTSLASMVSAPNRFGVYPLVDRTRNAWAVVAIDDDPVAPLQAVRDSAEVAQLMAAAIDTDGRPVRRPGSTIPR